MTVGELESACAWVGGLTLVIAVVLGAQGKCIHQPSKDGLAPVLTMELLRDRSDLPADFFNDRTGSDRIKLKTQMYLDFSFITAYVTLFILIGALALRHGDGALGMTMIGLAVLAGAFDVMENIMILRVLDQHFDGFPRNWSLAKWTLTFLILGLMIRVYLFREGALSHRIAGIVAAVLGFLAATVGLASVISNGWFPLARLFLSLDLAAGLLFFATHP